MAYNEFLADRVRQALRESQVSFEEMGMMGGLTFMVNGKMCLGIVKDSLMARIDPALYEDSLRKKGCREMDFTKRPMKGFVFVDPAGYDMDADLEHWIGLALEYNPRAKSSSNKK
jgi:TfoX/Sxy family transcriptional regulator of competence genes